MIPSACSCSSLSTTPPLPGEEIPLEQRMRQLIGATGGADPSEEEDEDGLTPEQRLAMKQATCIWGQQFFMEQMMFGEPEETGNIPLSIEI